MKKVIAKTAQAKNQLVRNLAIGIGLVIWVWFCIYFTKFLSLHSFRWLIQTFHIEDNTIIQSVYSLFVYLLAISIMLGVPLLLRKKIPKLANHPLFEKVSREEIGLKGLPTWTDILLSPIGFVAQLVFSAALVLLFSALFSWFKASETQEIGYSDLFTPGDKILAFSIIVIIVPIAEEIIFRGFLYGRLRKHLNLPVSMLLTSLLFAILHGQWNVGVNVFAVSLVLCSLREITGTIYAGILVHILKNAVAFYILFIAM